MTTCDLCGRAERDDVVAVAWTVSTDHGRRQTLCVGCSREHLRAMEGKLDPEWW